MIAEFEYFKKNNEEINSCGNKNYDDKNSPQFTPSLSN